MEALMLKLCACRGIIAVFTALAVLRGVVFAEPITLSDYRWANRLLIICDLQYPVHASRWTAAMTEVLAADPLNERRLRLGVIGAQNWRLLAPPYHQSVPPHTKSCATEACDGPYAQNDRRQLITRLRCTPDAVVFGLIGLDGGLKTQWRADAPPSPDTLFAVIDAKPMRLEEIRAQNQRE